MSAALEAWRLPSAGETLKLARTAVFPGMFLVISVLAGVGVLFVLAGFIFWQIHDAAHGGRYPGGAFSGYGAGIGLLIAQAVLLRRIEEDPELRRRIEEQG